MRTMRIMPGAASLLALMLVTLGAPSPSSAAFTTITVPTDFLTIQSAIDAADSGDTIRILAGIYTEQLTISKDLTIMGSGVESTIVNAPEILKPRQVNPRPRRAVIVEIFDGANVHIEKL